MSFKGGNSQRPRWEWIYKHSQARAWERDEVLVEFSPDLFFPKNCKYR